ncbi:MAG TPA: glycosyltransferase family 25 protein [Rhizomicrobium sp.]|jgi:glycosyl transferase family 25|nr:glycosyltransferase family 25 protein [Rhizomicrobium sp.]
MRIYVINLARRPDRMEAMAAQLGRLGLPFERFDAVDAKTCDPVMLNAPFAEQGAMAELTPGDKACTSSHMVLWREIAAGSDSHAVILEDDVLLSDAASSFLRGADWIPQEAGLIKIERYGDPEQLTLVGRGKSALDREVAPLLSRHPGSGGYIISREKAALLAAIPEKIAVPIDQLLFNPVYSPVFRALSPWQLVPAILEQQMEVGGGSDIRRARPPRSVKLRRSLRTLAALPKQIMSVLWGKARAVKISRA